MADFPIKTWYSVGEPEANDNNSVVNKDNMNDLEKRIQDTFKSMEKTFFQNDESVYIKWDDGPLIQYGFYETGAIPPKVLTSHTVKFPIPFKDTKYIIIPIKLAGGAAGFGNTMESVTTARQPDSCNLLSWNFGSGDTLSLQMGWLAIGMWK